MLRRVTIAIRTLCERARQWIHRRTARPIGGYRCGVCYSPNVRVVEWTDPNAGTVDAAGWDGCAYHDLGLAMSRGHTWCERCRQHTILVVRTAEGWWVTSL